MTKIQWDRRFMTVRSVFTVTSSVAYGGPPFRSPRNGPPLSAPQTFPAHSAHCKLISQEVIPFAGFQGGLFRPPWSFRGESCPRNVDNSGGIEIPPKGGFSKRTLVLLGESLPPFFSEERRCPSGMEDKKAFELQRLHLIHR